MKLSNRQRLNELLALKSYLGAFWFNEINMRKYGTCFLVSCGILAAGIFFRFYRLDSLSLWSDELFSVSAALNVGEGIPWYHFTSKVIQELTFQDSFLTWKAADNSPPLFEFLLIWWEKLFGSSDFSLRALPALLGSLAPAVLFFGLRRTLGDFPAMCGAALLAVSPSAVTYSQEVRSYTLALLLSSISAVRIINGIITPSPMQRGSRQGKKSIWIDVLIFIMMGYSHYTGLMMAALLAGIYVVFVSIPERKYFDFIKLLLVPLAILPWLLLSSKAFTFSSSGGYAWRDYHFHEVLDSMLPALAEFFLPGYGPVLFIVWLGALVVALAGYTRAQGTDFHITRLRNGQFDRRLALAIALMGAVGILFIYSVYNAFTSKMWHQRYFVVGLPVVCCSFSLLFSSPWLKRYISFLCFTPLVILSVMGSFSQSKVEKEDYREASYYIASILADKSTIILNWRPNEAFYRHYLDKVLPRTGKTYSYMTASTPEEIKPLCSEHGRGQYIMFQHSFQTPLYEELKSCQYVTKHTSKMYEGMRVDEFVF